MKTSEINPLTRMDYPDPEVIRVDNTYYMVSTTMHFMPGGAILKSYNLKDWELVSYVYETLDDTPAEKLEGELNIYGKGMWAPCLKYHKGRFYLLFVANNTHKTYLFTADNIEGPWTKSYIEGFYHDASLFFDDDDKVYVIYGNKTIYLTELNEELTGPKEGGLHRVIVEDKDHPSLGFEGTHFYKINGRYYAFFIHSLRDRWFRTEACYSSDTLTGEFTGGDVMQDDMGYRGSGIAQGGIVDTPDGDWYGILFQDRGAVGRIPVLVPVTWKDNMPVFGDNGKMPEEIEIKDLNPSYEYAPLYASDDFDDSKLKLVWQWNHNPDNSLWSLSERKNALRLYTGKICNNVTQSINTLTQRTYDPASEVSVTVDASNMKEGDYAGICALQGCYGAIAVTLNNGKYEIAVLGKEKDTEEKVYERVTLDNVTAELKCSFRCTDEGDFVSFYYKTDGQWIKLGPDKAMYFMLDHFVGCRYGLFNYATKEAGGYTDFMKYVYLLNK